MDSKALIRMEKNTPVTLAWKLRNAFRAISMLGGQEQCVHPQQSVLPQVIVTAVLPNVLGS